MQTYKLPRSMRAVFICKPFPNTTNLKSFSRLESACANTPAHGEVLGYREVSADDSNSSSVIIF